MEAALATDNMHVLVQNPHPQPAGWEAAALHAELEQESLSSNQVTALAIQLTMHTYFAFVLLAMERRPPPGSWTSFFIPLCHQQHPLQALLA